MANNKTKKRFKLHIKKGDKVKVLSGANKGATGEVMEIHVKNYRAIVEGVNLAKKHMKPTQDNPGGINEVAMPVHISNLMLLDPKTGDATRIGRKRVDGKLVRYSKKTGDVIS